MNKGLLIVFSAPSGAGKDTILSEVLKKDPTIKQSISSTTRAVRDGEIDGKDYFFTSKEDFMEMISNNELLEYVQYCDNYYGTPKKMVEKWLDEGYNVVLKIEVKGAEMVRSRCKDAVGVFVLPPSMKVLEERLLNRNTEDECAREKRLNVARHEVGLAFGYDYVVVNDNVDECASAVCNIIKSERYRSFRMTKIINEVLEND